MSPRHVTSGRWRPELLLFVLVLAQLVVLASPAAALVTVSRAEVGGGALRLEGTATPGRTVTVDGVAMGTSDSKGRFRIDRSPYTPPPDCTIRVDDGSGSPRSATLTGCSVTAPPPPPPSGQAAPELLSPADGASVTTPVTLTWSQVLDPTAQNGGYNWQVSSTSTFASLVARSSTTPATTRDTVGGLAPGTYHWQVQAVSAGLVSSAWSPPRSFVVTGAAPGALAAPTLGTLPKGAWYHPMEHFPFSWTAVAGAASYTVEADRDPTFAAPVEVRDTNVTATSSGFTFHASLVGDWSLRVRAVGPDGVEGPPSNVRTFRVSYDAPVGPAPTLVSPPTGASLALPITFDWDDVEIPQASGYELQVATGPAFDQVEVQGSQITSSRYELLSLPAGTHFWRVRHHEGDASPTTAAVTPWSEVRSFTVASTGPALASLWLGAPPCANPCPGTETLDSGQEIVVSVQLTAEAPAGGATVGIATSGPASGTHPSSVTFPAGTAYTQFRLFAGQVEQPTPVTLTATLNGSTAQASFTVLPTTVERLSFCCDSTGGFPAAAHLTFTGQVPPAGATIALASDSALATPPATVAAPGGSFSMPISIPTTSVSTATTVTISATWRGTTVSAPLLLHPQEAPTSVTLDRTETVATQGASGVVRIATPVAHEVELALSSSHPAIARTPPTARTGFQGTTAPFTVTTTAPSTTTVVTITATGRGVSVTTTLTVHPVAPSPPAQLTAPTLLSPANGARPAPGQTVAFDWSDVAGAGAYQLQVSTSSAFTSLLLERTVSTSALGASFAAEGDRWWRVRAIAPDGATGPWSATGTFRVKR